MPKKVRYYGIWDTFAESWRYKRRAGELFIAIEELFPDLWVINNTIGVWKDRKKLGEIFQKHFFNYKYVWEIREFTGLEAMKERMKNA